jgi:hypothetical protein
VQHNSDATTHLTIGIDNRIDNRIDDRDLIASPWAAVVGSSLHRRCIVVGSLPIVVASLPIVDCRSLIVDR